MGGRGASIKIKRKEETKKELFEVNLLSCCPTFRIHFISSSFYILILSLIFPDILISVNQPLL